MLCFFNRQYFEPCATIGITCFGTFNVGCCANLFKESEISNVRLHGSYVENKNGEYLSEFKYTMF
jgi:hypothetical protein